MKIKNSEILPIYLMSVLITFSLIINGCKSKEQNYDLDCLKEIEIVRKNLQTIAPEKIKINYAR